MSRKAKKVPEFVGTTIRKVEPVGGDIVRLYFAIEREGAWDDQVTLLMPSACVPASLNFAVASTREIAAEAAVTIATTH
jgi:hypothetical protein